MGLLLRGREEHDQAVRRGTRVASGRTRGGPPAGPVTASRGGVPEQSRRLPERSRVAARMLQTKQSGLSI